MSLESTPSQTIGPFPHEAWRWAFAPGDQSNDAVAVVAGVVYDGGRQLVDDAILEARTAGTHNVASPMAGLQRVASDEQGRFAFAVFERPVPGEPALVVTVFARGLVQQQFTAVWLSDAAEVANIEATAHLDAHATGPLTQVPAGRRKTLLAQPSGSAVEGGPQRYRWDIHLQGPDETVFFAFC